MKKNMLVALCAILSVVSANAYNITFANQTKDNNATRVIAGVLLMNARFPKTVTLQPGQKRKISIYGAEIPGSITVKGVTGAAAKKRENFRIPKQKLGKDITININVKNGKLKLSSV